MLKTIAFACKVVGWVALFGGLAAAIEVIVVPGVVSKLCFTNIYHSTWLLALAMMIGTVLYTMIFLALSEAIQAFLSIELNTRKLKELLDKK